MCDRYQENEMAMPEDPPILTSDERAWREGWAFAYSGAANLYGDDGELQDNRYPMIDWMRDPPLEIRRKIQQRAELQWAFRDQHREQLCRECGQPTMHMGDLCFACGKARKAST